MEPFVLIPAIKKNVAFPDDLVKKLAGVPLLQRVIENAVRAFSKSQVCVLTDSEEIQLLCSRLGVGARYDKNLRLDPAAYLDGLRPHLIPLTRSQRDIFVLSPYVPMMGVEDLRSAYRYYAESGAELLFSVINSQVRLFSPEPLHCADILHDEGYQELVRESRAFAIFRRDLLDASAERQVWPIPYRVSGRALEIRNYEDWWLCEKLINRRRIVFRVVGNREIGMGHIFRALSLAHEITDHEVRFICDRESEVAATKLAGYDYWLGVYPKDEIEKAIIDLSPDLVVNDILDTDASYIRRLKSCGFRVVNFEDLGSGASEADLTINDLYDSPLLPGKNIRWGSSWFFVRDEFASARPNRFSARVNAVMIAFGGTDPSDLTRKVLRVIAPYCAQRDIEVVIVTGDGYGPIKELEAMIADTSAPRITYTHATGVISHLMEQVQAAICSNGRMVYELAHMNVPAIVLSHHEREKTHRFACSENGFVPLGVHRGEETDQQVLAALVRLVEDCAWRREMHSSQRKSHFTRNKRKVVERILSLLPKGRQV